MKRILILTVVLTALAFTAGAAQTVGVSGKDTTIMRGTSFLFGVRADSNLTGLGVSGYTMTITYDVNSWNIDSIISAGTLTASWGNPTYHLSPGSIVVAGAGASVLSGSGVLFYIRMTAPLTKNGGGYYITLQSGMFNEGTPRFTVDHNAYVGISNPPNVYINGPYSSPTVGETTQLSAGGGTAPYTWSVTDGSVASIDNNGVVTGLQAGTCRAIVADQNGYRDTSAIITVLPYRLLVRDTSFLQGQTFSLPVYISDLSQVNITSGQFTLSFNGGVMRALGTVETGSALQPYGASTVLITPGSISISFAGTSRLNVVGRQVLVWVRFTGSSTTYGMTGLTFSSVLMNENLAGNVTNGNIGINNRAILSVYAPTFTLVAGDSVQLSPSGNATQPVTWALSDTTLASISAGGMLKAKRGGHVTVTVTDAINALGTSQPFDLYDSRARLGAGNGQVGDTVSVPFSADLCGIPFSSFQFVVQYQASALTPLGVSATDGAWSAGMGTPSNGYVTVGAMSDGPASGGTQYLTMRFIINPGTYPTNYQLTLLSVVFNEGSPRMYPMNGMITVNPNSVREPHNGIPGSFVLEQNYPNPFNPSTTVSYGLPAGGFVRIAVYNMAGQLVSTLVSGMQQPGWHEITWYAGGAPSGVYICRLQAGTSAVQAIKLMLVK